MRQLWSETVRIITHIGPSPTRSLEAFFHRSLEAFFHRSLEAFFHRSLEAFFHGNLQQLFCSFFWDHCSEMNITFIQIRVTKCANFLYSGNIQGKNFLNLPFGESHIYHAR
jgi:hypothetical protein